MIYPDIETYIEVISGRKDPVTLKQSTSFWAATPIIQLASYDVQFVQSVATQLSEKISLTDRQANLVEKLIQKYDRQLRNKGIEQPTEKNYRLGIRTIDRSRSVFLADGVMYFRFPFDNRIIQDVRAYIKEAKGMVAWDHERKVWKFGLTEYNVNWLVTYAEAHNVSISPEVQELFDAVIETEKTPYAIELRMGEDQTCYIENCPQSLSEYITENIGFNDLCKLLDYSGVLGYTISKEIQDVVESQYGEAFLKLCTGRAIDFDPTNNSLTDLIKWATIVDRFPILVYNPNVIIPALDPFRKFFTDEEIKVINLSEKVDGPLVVDSFVKIVYTNKVLGNWQGRIPLLITYANLMHGPTKRNLLNSAEKVVYYCDKLPTK